MSTFSEPSGRFPNLTSLSQVRRLLEDLSIRPSRSLGQNFLVDRNVLDIVAQTAEAGPRDRVLEIGPGLGVVTEFLVASDARVLAVERDHRLHRYLAERFEDADRLQLVRADLLDMDMDAEPLSGVTKVVSNLPYRPGTRMLVMFARAATPAACLVVTVQREVAERLTAGPGTGSFGRLTVWMQSLYDIEIVKRVSATCFWPRPEVESAIVKMKRKPGPLPEREERDFLFELAKLAFTRRRKQLVSTLAGVGLTRAGAADLLEELGHSVRARPEDLSASDWVRLVRETRREGGLRLRVSGVGGEDHTVD